MFSGYWFVSQIDVLQVCIADGYFLQVCVADRYFLKVCVTGISYRFCSRWIFRTGLCSRCFVQVCVADISYGCVADGYISQVWVADISYGCVADGISHRFG